MKLGKLDSDLLEEIVFDKLKLRREEVLVRPGIGEDCAVVDYGNSNCVISSDPITAAAKDIGSLAIHVSCNDIASNGIEPIGIMLTVMLPEQTTREELEKIIADAARASEELGIEIIGGHTEITNAVTKPIIVSTAIGKEEKKKHLEMDLCKNIEKSRTKIAVGDIILMTKTAGLEGTAIIASDLEDELTEILSIEEIQTAKNFMKDISVVPEGVMIGKIGFSAMHDITEGGVLGAIWELCQVGKVGAKIEEKAIPVAKVTKKISAKYNIDPLRLISSGSMLIILPKEKKKEAIKALEGKNIRTTEIGEITEIEEGDIIAAPTSDEIYKIF
ncbi:MAG: AIR synthase family protein [Anaerovoracaceae bacterium]